MAVAAAADDITQGALRALHEKGLRVPEDVSLAGIDDIPLTRMLVPALIALQLPVQAVVRTAFKIVTDGKTASANDKVVTRPKLIIREFCAPPQSSSAVILHKSR